MARTGRTWSDFDVASMTYFSELRADAGTPSYRKMAEITGIKFNRIMDLLKHQNGTPTLQEFIDLCLGFGKDPADTMRTIIEQLEAQGIHLTAETATSILTDNDHTTDTAESTDASALADDIAAHPDRYDLAANTDPNKALEAETPRD